MRFRYSIGLALLLFGAWLTGCKAPPPPEALILDFATAIQQSNTDELFCLSAGAGEAAELGADLAARREGFKDWVQAEMNAYLESRDEGWVELTGGGIQAVKLFSLAKGTYFELLNSQSDGADALYVDTRLVFGYGRMDLSGLSPGTTFYLCGTPVGTVLPIKVPMFSRTETGTVLDELTLRWRIVRQLPPEGCEATWAVESVSVLEETARETEVSWSF